MTLDDTRAEYWAKHPQATTMLEATLQRGVENLLTAHGWRWYHTHDSRRSAAGFPDLCAVRARDGRLLFAELKKQKNAYPSPDQRAWIADLTAIADRTPYAPELFPQLRALVEVYLWRPSDFLSGDIERVLR